MDEFTTPYEDDDAQFIECKVWWLNVTKALVNEFETSAGSININT